MTRFRTNRVSTTVLIAATAGILLAGCHATKSAGVAGGAPNVAATATNAGAGGTKTAAAAGNVPDACGLITEQDASSAIGKASGPGVSRGSADAPQCVYGDGQLIIDVSSAQKADYDALHSSMTVGPAGSWREVTGLGTAAFEVSGGPSALVYFFTGTTLVEIILQGKLSPPVDAAITVAKAAATHG